jgi:CheY-like chemotaxis protein
MTANILIVEDNDDIRTTLASLLKAAGYGVVCKTNGREALDYLRTADPPTAILLDLNMPVMNGWEFRQEQRQDPALAAIPVLLLSGEPHLSRTAASIGAAGHIAKPVEVGCLFRSIHLLSMNPQSN